MSVPREAQNRSSNSSLSLGKTIELIIESKCGDQTNSKLYVRDLKARSDRFIIFLRAIGKYNKRPSRFVKADALSFMDGFTSSKTYYNNIKRYMSAVFQFGVDRDWLENNPFKDIRFKAQEYVRHIPFQFDQMIDLLKFMDDTGRFRELRICANLVYSSFLRPHQEVRLLKRSDFTADLKLIILDGKRTKNSRRRLVAVDDETRTMLIDRGFLDLKDNDNIWSKKVEPFAQYYFNNQWRWLAKLDEEYSLDSSRDHVQILKPGQTLYSFRHTGAIAFYKVHQDIGALQRLLDHSNVLTTETYLRGLALLSDQAKQAPDKYEMAKQSTAFVKNKTKDSNLGR
jgi:integrase